MTKVVDLTPERLRAALAYDPDTGVFTWRNPASDKMKAGDIAGTLNHGRIQNGSQYRARVGHLHVGSFPTIEQARQAYLEAKRRLHEGCTL